MPLDADHAKARSDPGCDEDDGGPGTNAEALPSLAAVGYGRPPIHSRFKPGQSGNPRGRPKGARGITSIVAGVLARKVVITEAGRPRKITITEANIRRIAELALKGDLRACRILIELEDRFGTGAASAQATPSAQEDDALIESYVERLRGAATRESD
jgi:hypothetical protein